MAKEIQTPYKMDLVQASKSKLYNQGALWAFNIAKYRALLSNDPIVIRHFYRHEAGMFHPDVYQVAEIQRSFYYGDEFIENAEEYFGIIPMICESIAKMVCGSGYDFDEAIGKKIRERLQAIIDDNEFDTETLKSSMIETIGLGDAAWHVHFDPEVSDLPIIEFVPPERLEIRRKCKRIVEYKIKQQIVIDGEPQPYELHTTYTKRRTKLDNGRYKDDGILQRFRIWNGSNYIVGDSELKKKVFKAYDIKESSILPLCDFPVVYLPNTLNDTQGKGVFNDARPYGVVFGLETVSAAIDEILSNAVDTVRKSFPFLLIDEQMIPSNLDGEKEKGMFSTRRHSWVLPRNVKDGEKLLQQIQAKLNTTEFVEALKFQINIALNKAGINAATLGLQLSGHVEAEATQNAKERNSIRTRNTIAADYQRYLSKLFAVLLQYEDYINGNMIATDPKTGEEAIVAEDYHNIKVEFRKYIVDTPEEVAEVLARKVQGNLMSIFAAVREQHPEWDDETIIKETNLILAQKYNVPIQVEDTSKPAGKSTTDKDNPTDDDPATGNKDLQGDETPKDDGQTSKE